MARRHSAIFFRLTTTQQTAWLRVSAWVHLRATTIAAGYGGGSTTWPDDLTAVVLREMRTTPSVAADYIDVVGNPFGRGNRVKAALNRHLGMTIKRAANAIVRHDDDGEPVMRKVQGEWHFTYTVLDAPRSAA